MVKNIILTVVIIVEKDGVTNDMATTLVLAWLARFL
jgi:hypothetical protein